MISYTEGIYKELKRMNDLKEMEIAIKYFEGNGSHVDYVSFINFCQKNK